MTDKPHNRGAIQLVDAVLTVFVLVSIIATAPIWYHFIDLLRSASGISPFTKAVLSLLIPSLLIGLLLSVGISARRGT